MSGQLIPFALGYLLGKASGGFSLFGDTSYKGGKPPSLPVIHKLHPEPVHADAPPLVPVSTTSTAISWGESTPAGLPPFPSGWRATATTPSIVQRAWGLMNTLPVGQTKYEHGGPNGWLAFHASSEKGKKYVTAWEPKGEAFTAAVPTYQAQPGQVVHQAAPVAAPIPHEYVSPRTGSSHATIKRGSSGADVALWQRRVGVKDDGNFGPATEAATKTFQRTHHLTPDGIVGPITWSTSESVAA